MYNLLPFVAPFHYDSFDDAGVCKWESGTASRWSPGRVRQDTTRHGNARSPKFSALAHWVYCLVSILFPASAISTPLRTHLLQINLLDKDVC